jgi:outer membrane protein OmpA-like peptidoglycan-associated protein
MNNKSIQLSSAALVLALSVSGCSWIRSINPWASDEPEPAKVAQAESTVSDAHASEPIRVASHDGSAHSHVQDSAGKTVTSGYGDCVNIGATLNSTSSATDCDKQGLKPASDAGSAREEMAKPAAEPAPMPKPAPVAKPEPMNENGNGAPGIVQDTSGNDAGKATAEVKPGKEMATVAPSYEKISLQGDALFRFGKSDEGSILPAGVAKLDNLAAQLAAYNRDSIESISVVGHADRLGKKVPNQALSERRALTVKNYLIKHGVDGSIIKSAGKGSSQPVKQCQGKKKTPALVACLEPNRRVEVVIRGVKGN